MSGKLSDPPDMIWGRIESGPGGATTPLIQGLTPLGGAMEQPTNPKATVRKVCGAWFADCPCGFMWTSRFHRIALLMATTHTHWCEVA